MVSDKTTWEKLEVKYPGISAEFDVYIEDLNFQLNRLQCGEVGVIAYEQNCKIGQGPNSCTCIYYKDGWRPLQELLLTKTT